MSHRPLDHFETLQTRALNTKHEAPNQGCGCPPKSSVHFVGQPQPFRFTPPLEAIASATTDVHGFGARTQLKEICHLFLIELLIAVPHVLRWDESQGQCSDRSMKQEEMFRCSIW